MEIDYKVIMFIYLLLFKVEFGFITSNNDIGYWFGQIQETLSF